LIQDELEAPMFNWAESLDLDSASGNELDIIGEIVGQRREILDYSEVKYFGFADSVGSLGFGDLYNSNVGGRFRSLYEPTENMRLLEDPEYRIFIRARILRNKSKGTRNEILSAIETLFGTQGVDLVLDPTDPMTVDVIYTGVELSATNQYIIQNYDILPLPAGMQITSIEQMAKLSVDDDTDLMFSDDMDDYLIFE
jgi:hypothetical protein